ncbi:hypothetical protein [Teredinibacter haidensis]|uniref:hypothetical protein n=1 Tax=Teredinibacter haidensis TaxID=2731755 RepID=UPI000948BD93|nr:hypothetical protein [Teredinibacter haidensis]
MKTGFCRYMFGLACCFTLSSCGGGSGGTKTPENGGVSSSASSASTTSSASSSSASSQDQSGDKLGNCDVSGRKLLALMGTPLNKFDGSSFSEKVWNTQQSLYGWYPLELGLSENPGKSSISIDSDGFVSQECMDLANYFLADRYLYPEVENQWSIDIRLKFSKFDYNTFFEFSDSEEITMVHPHVEIQFEELERLEQSGSYTVVRQVIHSSVELTCEVPFSVTSSWIDPLQNSNLDPETTYVDVENNLFALTHVADFNGDGCIFSLTDTFTLKNGVDIDATLYGELEAKYDQDILKGYDFKLNGIHVGSL